VERILQPEVGKTPAGD